MSIPEPIRSMIKAAIEQEEKDERENQRLLSEVRGLIVDKGVSLHPKGVNAVIALGAAIAHELHHHNGPECMMLKPPEALKLADQFMLRWAQERQGAPCADSRLDSFFAPKVPEIKIT